MGLASALEIAVQNKEWIALFGTLVIGALTARQVKAIRERDYNRCEAPFPHRHYGRLNVHHIENQAYTHGQGADYGDYEENLITLCEGAHRMIHPELPQVLEEYRRGDKDAFKKMAQRHHIEGQQGIVGWNDRWDHCMHARARKNTVEAERRGWEFPPPAKKRGDEDGN